MSQTAKERILNVLIVLAVIVLAFVLIYPQYKMNQPTKVKIAIDRSFAGLPIFIAQDKGYFKNEKVIPEIVTVNDPDERAQGLTNGEYGLTILPWFLVLDAEHPYLVIASAETRQLKPASALLAVPKSRIKGLRDLKGKKVGLLRESEHYFDELAQNLPSRVTKLHKVIIEPNEIEDVISTHRVDALFLFEPYRGLAISKGATLIQDAPLAFFIQRGYPVVAYCLSKDYLEKNKIGARRIRDAVDAAIRHIIKNSGQAKELLYNRLNIDGNLLYASLVEFQRGREINSNALNSYAARFNLPIKADSVIAFPADFER